MTETVFEYIPLGNDNVNLIQITSDDETDDFGFVDRVKITLSNDDVIDSAINPEFFSWSAGDESYIFLLSLQLGDADIESGCYTCDVTVFDPSHPDGQRIIIKEKEELVLRFV